MVHRTSQKVMHALVALAADPDLLLTMQNCLGPPRLTLADGGCCSTAQCFLFFLGMHMNLNLTLSCNAVSCNADNTSCIKQDRSPSHMFRLPFS